MEKGFKILFSLAVFVACLVIIGIFLIIMKIALMFVPVVHLMGLSIQYNL